MGLMLTDLGSGVGEWRGSAESPPYSTAGGTRRKICLLGDYSVGKSSLVRRFVVGRFSADYLSTIGVQVSRHSLTASDPRVDLLIWDLAGGRDFQRANEHYMKGAAGALIVADLTRPETVASLEAYAGRLRAVEPAAAVVILGNKGDLIGHQSVSEAQLAAAAAQIGAPWLVTSALTGANVAEAFALLAGRTAVFSA